ncbi:MAG: hypothetical protein SXA11_16695 [Cyanobacteriota bacterium]|nr:hypothetical protein [Cyanobacteriota bacterium]
MSEPQPEKKQEEKQQPPPKPSFETERKASRKFLLGPVQTFIQWMPIGGSGWAFVSFLLEEYLKNHQWRDAGIETNRLMLQTVAREKNDFITIEEIKDFR